MNKKLDKAFVLITAILTIILFFIPTGFEPDQPKTNFKVKAKVIEVDNSDVKQFRIIKTGPQQIKIKILDSKFKGQTVTAINTLIGKMEFDKVYRKGDIVYTILETKGDKIIVANVIDRYRLNVEFILLVIFILLVVLYAGYTGMKAVLSFVFATLIIWKILLPGFLKGINPIFLSLVVVMALTFVIIFLIGGLTKKGSVAFLGAMSGVLLTCLLSIIFGNLFKISGAVKPFAETLLYTGFPNINLTNIFLAGIFIASSGAVMDISMDIAASMQEITLQNPKIPLHELIMSGFSVGKAVIGTMTTTLLLAYSGGYTAMLLVFIGQRTPISNILNLQYISSEILHTLVGSFGLVTVAPFTAIIGGVIFAHKKEKFSYIFKLILNGIVNKFIFWKKPGK